MIPRGLSIAAILFLASAARAGPPFLTDDPDPVDYQHWEFYLFGFGERSPGANAITGPAVELNYGIAPNTQLHLVVPDYNLLAPGSNWTSGLGDTEFGVKYRLVSETPAVPEIGLFPMAEFDTGDAAKGLGNGKTWYRLPLWFQKSWGPWTADAGGGADINPAPGQHDTAFFGGLLQRDLGKYVTVGAELFHQPADPQFGRAAILANFGGYLKFSDTFNLLFSAGRSLGPGRYTVWYLGLYWTGGPERAPQR